MKNKVREELCSEGREKAVQKTGEGLAWVLFPSKSMALLL